MLVLLLLFLWALLLLLLLALFDRAASRLPLLASLVVDLALFVNARHREHPEFAIVQQLQNNRLRKYRFVQYITILTCQGNSLTCSPVHTGDYTPWAIKKGATFIFTITLANVDRFQ